MNWETTIHAMKATEMIYLCIGIILACISSLSKSSLSLSVLFADQVLVISEE